MFNIQALTPDQINLCRKTMSSNAFYMVVADALIAKRGLSVVRMGDGEVELLDELHGHHGGSLVGPISTRDEAWRSMLGINGIPRSELLARLEFAAYKCTYFAPSVSGIQREDYHLHSRFASRDIYVDNFFVNDWTDAMRIALYKQAGHILFIHRNPVCGDWFIRRCLHVLGVKVSYLRLQDWTETHSVIDQARVSDAPLVLFSGGPAGKYIGPAIEQSSAIPKVVLDLGNASDQWLLETLQKETILSMSPNAAGGPL